MNVTSKADEVGCCLRSFDVNFMLCCLVMVAAAFGVVAGAAFCFTARMKDLRAEFIPGIVSPEAGAGQRAETWEENRAMLLSWA